MTRRRALTIEGAKAEIAEQLRVWDLALDAIDCRAAQGYATAAEWDHDLSVTEKIVRGAVKIKKQIRRLENEEFRARLGGAR